MPFKRKEKEQNKQIKKSVQHVQNILKECERRGQNKHGEKCTERAKYAHRIRETRAKQTRKKKENLQKIVKGQEIKNHNLETREKQHNNRVKNAQCMRRKRNKQTAHEKEFIR